MDDNGARNQSAAPRRDTPSTQWSFRLLCLAALVLPFEAVRPLLPLPLMVLTSVELAVGAFTVVALASPAVHRRLSSALRPADALLLAFLGTAFLSAVLAPEGRVEALKFALRLLAGALFMVAVAGVLAARPRYRPLLWALAAGAGVSALLGVGEVAGWPLLRPVLALFKEAPSRVGGTLRLSASFQYATIAAAYYEMALPLLLVLAAIEKRQRRWGALGLAALLVVGAVLTLTRSTLAVMAALLALLGWLAATDRRAVRLRGPVALAAVVLGLSVGVLAWQVGPFRARLTTENDLNWYNARYTVPATLRVRSGQTVTVTVQVQNTGAIPWHPDGETPFALGVYWRSEDGSAVVNTGHVEWPLPRTVNPGETVSLQVAIPVRLPPGTYRLTWGMLQRDILWFRHRGVPEASTLVRVEGAAPVAEAEPPLRPPERLPSVPPTVPRRQLWRAALAMWQERPLLGYGPDTFRLRYGPYIGLEAWDRRLHANNLYLELLADTGLLGLGTFLAFLGTSGWAFWSRQRALAERAWLVLVGAAGGGLAFLLHGVLDTFLGFTPTASLFWLLLGIARSTLVTARRRGPSGAGERPEP